MREISNRWMAYIDAEVRAVCLKQGWGHQIRRKWSVRDKPVSQSLVDDYEWKLIPAADAELPEGAPSEFDYGTYYVLSFDPGARMFVLQHDTDHCGMFGRPWHRRSYTEIDVRGWVLDFPEFTQREHVTNYEERLDEFPEVGWLQNHLLDLTARFEPNHFSET